MKNREAKSNRDGKEKEIRGINPDGPKTVSPAYCVKENPSECFEVRHGKLFCVACREEISLKKSMVRNYIYCGNKHKDAKDKLAKKEAREHITNSLVAVDKSEQPAGTSVSVAERVY